MKYITIKNILIIAMSASVIWIGYLIFESVTHPIPAGACDPHDGLCTMGQTFLGNVEWGAYWAMLMLAPFWAVIWALVLLIWSARKFRSRKQAVKA